MKHEDLESILEKMGELKALFLLGQRTVQILQDLFAFIQQIVPIAEELKAAAEATSGKLPKASQHLEKVTHATEVASIEILDIVEGVLAKLEGMQRDLKHTRVVAEGLQQTAQRVETFLQTMTDEPWNHQNIEQLKALLQEHFQVLQTHIAEDNFQSCVDGIQDDCTNIMMALQVQDITAQQIAAVNHLMQSVDENLTRLLRHFNEVEVHADALRYRHPHLDIPFDDSAEYFGTEERQNLADSFLEEPRLGKKRKDHDTGRNNEPGKEVLEFAEKKSEKD